MIDHITNRFASESACFLTTPTKRAVMKTGRSISVASGTLKTRHLEAVFFQSVIDKIPGVLTDERLPGRVSKRASQTSSSYDTGD